MLFTDGRSVLGKTVPEVSSTLYLYKVGETFKKNWKSHFFVIACFLFLSMFLFLVLSCFETALLQCATSLCA